MSPAVAIVEPFGEGHHPMYVAGYWHAFRALGCETLFVGPESLATDAEAAFPGHSCVIPREARVSWDPVGSGRLRGLTASEVSTLLWRELRAALADRRVDLVFLLSLDSFVPETTPDAAVAPVPWVFSGLWFRPPSRRPRSLREAARRLARCGRRFSPLRADRCGPILVLHHQAAISHLSRLVRRGVIPAPEFSTYERSASTTARISNVFDRIGGRRAVVLAGSLEPRKGVRDFIRAAEAADPSKWAFVMAGRLYRQVFDSETLAALERVTAGEHPRVLLLDGWLEATELNDVVAKAALLFVCYDKWDFSTNMLCKSSYFAVPVIAYPRGYAGHMVQSFGLGVLVRDNHDLIDTFARSSFECELDALRQSGRFMAGCARYLQDNDVASLETPLETLLQSIPLHKQEGGAV